MKHIVMQIEDGRAVLLDNKGNFITVRDNGYKVGQTIQYRNTAMRSAYAAAASLIMVIGLGVGGYKLYYTPVSYLSIEINPSIQLSINIFDRVIGCEYFNDDGKVVLDDVNVINLRSKPSVEQIIDKAQSIGYLTERNNSVIIDVVENNTALVENLTPLHGEYISKNIEVTVESATIEDAKLSKDKNISIAKAKAVNEYSQVFGGDAEENSEVLKKVPVKTVREKNETVSKEKAVKVQATINPFGGTAVKKSDKKVAPAVKNESKPTNKPVFEEIVNSGTIADKELVKEDVAIEETIPEITEEPKKPETVQNDRNDDRPFIGKNSFDKDKKEEEKAPQNNQKEEIPEIPAGIDKAESRPIIKEEPSKPDSVKEETVKKEKKTDKNDRTEAVNKQESSDRSEVISDKTNESKPGATEETPKTPERSENSRNDRDNSVESKESDKADSPSAEVTSKGNSGIDSKESGKSESSSESKGSPKGESAASADGNRAGSKSDSGNKEASSGRDSAGAASSKSDNRGSAAASSVGNDRRSSAGSSDKSSGGRESSRGESADRGGWQSSTSFNRGKK